MGGRPWSRSGVRLDDRSVSARVCGIARHDRALDGYAPRSKPTIGRETRIEIRPALRADRIRLRGGTEGGD